MLKITFKSPRPPDMAQPAMLVYDLSDAQRPHQLAQCDRGTGSLPALGSLSSEEELFSTSDHANKLTLGAEHGAKPIEDESPTTKRIDQLDTRLLSIVERLNSMEARLTGIERTANRSDAVAAQVQEVQEEVVRIQGNINEAYDNGGTFPDRSTEPTALNITKYDADNAEIVTSLSPTIAASECPSCRGLAAERSSTTLKLEESLEHGCQLCALLFEIARAYVTSSYRPEPEVDEVVVQNKSASLPTVYVSNRPSGWIYGTCYLDIFEDPLDQLPRYPILAHSKSLPAPPRDPNIGSEGFLCNIPTWIKKCAQDHPECAVQSTTYLPKRVLDLAPLHEGRDLILHEPESQTSDYICLSHCWGDSQPVRTMSATLAEFKNGISLTTLPQTFCDAITVAQYLDIRYLWIDSLCIIQDDLDDWEVQAAQMADIYGRAFLTIAGTSAANANAGLFAENCNLELRCARRQPLSGDPSLSLIYREATTHTQLRLSSVEARNKFHDENTEDEAAANDDSIPYPLLSRSWTFQEHLLSPRIAQFTHKEIVWECSRETWCCCTTGNHLLHGRKHFAAALLSPGRAVPDNPSNNPNLPNLYQVWYDLVVRYTSKKLAYDEDRLTALSGLAQRAQPILGSTYLAGLWSGDLLAGLCWYSANRSTSSDSSGWWIAQGFHLEGGDMEHAPLLARRPIQYRAPSWSWASVEGGIAWLESVPQAGNFIVRGYDCVAASQDPTGRVKSGYLDVECKVVECQYDGFFHGAHYRVGRDQAWAIFDADLPFQSAPYNTVLPVGGKVHCIVIGDTSQIYRSSYDRDYAVLILRKSQASPE